MIAFSSARGFAVPPSDAARNYFTFRRIALSELSRRNGMKLLRWTLAGAGAYVIYRYSIGRKAKGEDVFQSPPDEAQPALPQMGTAQAPQQVEQAEESPAKRPRPRKAAATEGNATTSKPKRKSPAARSSTKPAVS
jgi:hypothetical protein